VNTDDLSLLAPAHDLMCELGGRQPFLFSTFNKLAECYRFLRMYAFTWG